MIKTLTPERRLLLGIENLLLNEQSEDPVLSKIYRLVHISNGTCHANHDGWKQEYEHFINLSENDIPEEYK